MKRGFFVLLLVALAAAISIVACAATNDTGFADVDAGAWYAEAVEYCQREGIMTGVDDGHFDPYGTVTRATVWTVLARLDGANTAAPAGQPWYRAACDWAVENGVSDGENPGGSISREQLATMLYRYHGSPAVTAGEDFADQGAISAWAVDGVRWAKETGVVNGVGEGRFDPQGNANRAQLATVVKNYLTAAVAQEEQPKPSQEPTPDLSTDGGATVLVAYFSATHNTEGVAKHIQAVLGERADIYEIRPEEPYTSADLNYNTDCRANREQNDAGARPAISGGVEDMARYDVVFLGYPIWWGTAPKIIHTFLESYDFAGKTIVPFCTSGSSGYSDSAIRPLAADATWQTGRRFGGGASQEAVAQWVDSLNLNLEPSEEEISMRKLTISFGEHTYSATLEENDAAAAFAELLESKGGAMTIHMSEYGGWEKVGSLGQSLPSNDTQTTTVAGDFVLYSGDQIVLFYGSNSWSYTRLGRLDDPAGLRDALGSGDRDVTFALEKG